MNTEALFKRTKDVLKLELARVVCALFVGVGSLGARVAEELVRFGVRRIVLLDKAGEKMEEHNVIRHPLGYSALGRLKIEAMAERLRDINPECDVKAVGMDVTREPQQLQELMEVEGVTEAHVTVDNEPARHAFNQVALKTKLPLVFYGGVYNGGVGGEVLRVRPGEACYACLSSHLGRHLDLSKVPTKAFNYENPDDPEFKSTSALNLDINQIAIVQARFSLWSIMAREEPAKDPKFNYVLFGNREVPNLFPRPLHSEFLTIPRDPDDLICGEGNGGSGGGGIDYDAEVKKLLAGAKTETE